MKLFCEKISGLIAMINYLTKAPSSRGRKLSHKNKKALSPFYHKNIFDRKIRKTPYNKMDLRLFYFCVTILSITVTLPWHYRSITFALF